MLVTISPVTKYPAFLISPEDLDLSIDCVMSDTHDAMLAMLRDAELKISSRRASRKAASTWMCNDGIGKKA
jgi:hypothetical protein